MESAKPKYSLQLILDEALDLMHERIKDNAECIVQTEYKGKDGLVSANRPESLNVFINIIENALEAMNDGAGLLRIVSKPDALVWDLPPLLKDSKLSMPG